MAIRVVLADDSAAVRAVLIEVLSQSDDIELVGVAVDGRTLHDLVAATLPDVVITDVRMPPTGTDEGIRVAEHLAGTHAHVGVVIVAQQADPQHIDRVMVAGSAGRAWVLKERAHHDGQLVAAVRAVHAGRTWVDARIDRAA
jgi:DNA-binding NarL/FixJ family response regulator